MIKLYSLKKTEKIINEMEPAIRRASGDYHVPEAFIKAILYREIKEIDLADAGVDMIVKSQVLSKLLHRRDSSTGYAQIYGFVAVNALKFAEEQGLEKAENLGFPPANELSPKNTEDVRKMWLKLHQDPEFNLRLAVLNMASAAYEMTGSLDFSAFSDDDLKRVFSRYNANTKEINAYGKEVFGYYQRYLKEEENKETA